MSTRVVGRGIRGFLKHHSLSLAAGGIILLWVFLYSRSSPATHLGSFFGNAIADWLGVLVAVIATKYFYEIGSAESRQPRGQLPTRFREVVRDHSLTIYWRSPESPGRALCRSGLESNGSGAGKQSVWGETTSRPVLMTKRLFELRSKESRPQPPKAR